MKILFLDETHPILYSIFEKKGWTIEIDTTSSMEQIESKLPLFNGLIVRSRMVLDEQFISHAKNLKFIGRPGAGLENIAVEFAEKKGIHVFRSPEGNRDSVAEHGIGMLLMLFNKLNSANWEVKNGQWNRKSNWGEEVMGKTVGLIGYGVMGKAMAQRFSGFGVNCIAYDKYLDQYSDEFCKQVSLEELKKTADVVSLHTPLTEETKGYLNEAFINSMSKPFYLINTARGQSVVLNDLVKGLKSKKVLGACLDVLEYEKTTFESMFDENKTDSFDYLAKAHNVLLSPHVAGWTQQSNVKIAQFLGERITEHFH